MLQYINVFISTLALSLLEAFHILKRDALRVPVYFENFIENFKKIIWSSLIIVTLIVGAISIIYTIHVAPDFATRGLNIYFGGIVALALIRECAPVMGALAIVTFYSTGMTAQIGSMKITEQLDAMKIAKVAPSAYLLAPMLIAGFIGFPIVVLIGIFIGLFISFVSSYFLIHITYNVFVTSILNAVIVKDIMLALIKAAAFGFSTALISYTCGILTHGGAKAVGNSTKLSVVINFGVIVILDYFITALWL